MIVVLADNPAGMDSRRLGFIAIPDIVGTAVAVLPRQGMACQAGALPPRSPGRPAGSTTHAPGGFPGCPRGGWR
jgi:hypothetical protein